MIDETIEANELWVGKKKKDLRYIGSTTMMHELLPMHVASRLSGKKKTRRKGDTKLGEIRITYYIAMNPTRLRKVTRSVCRCAAMK